MCARPSYDYIYLAAHGNHTCFAENGSPLQARWADFGLVLCRSQILCPSSVVFLGCCHGGLKKVASILFFNCDQIVSVCGPHSTTTCGDVSLALHTFLHSIEFKLEEQMLAAERASQASGQSFPIHCRYDFEADLTIFRSNPDGRDPDFDPSDEIESCVFCGAS